MELIPVGEGYVVQGREEERKMLRYLCPKRKSKMVYSLWTWRVRERWKGDYNVL